MRRAAAILLLAAMGACGEPQASSNGASPQENAPAQVTTSSENKPATTENINEIEINATATPGSAEKGALPPASRPLRFVGSWATSEANCRDKAWLFTATGLDTPAGSQCRFTNIEKVPGGYDIAARCTAEAPPVDDRITLRFAESARAMLFQSRSIADAGLIYCGK